MDLFRKTDPLNLNGLFRAEDEKKKRNYKLMVDPAMRQGHQKVYRFDGILAGEPPVMVRDPRSRMKRYYRKIEAANLPVPKFKYDQYYVGAILPKEVTFTNLNDNINQKFLKDMCKGFGTIEDAKIYFHPKTKKHLGIGKVMYNSTKAARLCAEKLHRTSKMGNIMNVFVDAMGKERQRMVEEATTEKPKARPPSPKSRRGPLSKMISPDFRSREHDLRTPFSDQPTPGSSVDHGYGSGSLVSGQSEQFAGPHTPGAARHGYQENYGGFQAPQGMPPPNNMGYNCASGAAPDQGYPAGPSSHGPAPPHGPTGPVTSNTPAGPPPHSHSHNYHGDPNDRLHMDEPDKHHRHRTRKDSDDYYDNHTSERDRNRSHRHRRHGDKHRHRNRDRDRDRDREKERDYRYSKNDDYDYPYEEKDSSFEYEEHSRHHRHRDRRRSRNSEDPRSRHKSESTSEWASPPPPTAPVPKPPTPEPVTEVEPVPDQPRFQSLESRIQSLLSLTKDVDIPFGSPSDEAVSGSEDRLAGTPQTQDSVGEGFGPQPPLPAAPLPPDELSPPPLPPEPAPPPEPLEEKPPLPEEPEPEVCDMQNHMFTNSHARGMRSLRHSAEDDDRMSLSSISSGEEKLEVNTGVPAQNIMYMQQQQQFPPQSVMYQQAMWQNQYPHMLNPYQNNMLNNSFSSTDDENMTLEAVQQKALRTFTQTDKEQETMFVGVLDQIINELKMIMCKDMRKKMVETSAFKAFEGWWDCEQKQVKLSRLPHLDEPLPADPVLSSTTPAPTIKPSESHQNGPITLPPREPAEPIKDTASSLASLFESKEGNALAQGSGFGGGGLLGLRGVIPKMPSFRKKFRPPSPPPEEEEEFRGPRTPEESDADEDKVSDQSEDEAPSEADQDSKPSLRRSRVIWSSDSDSDDDDDESEEEEEDEEEEEEDSAASVASSGSEEESEESEDESEDDSDSDVDTDSGEEKLDSESETGVSTPTQAKPSVRVEEDMEVEPPEKPAEDKSDVAVQKQAPETPGDSSRLSPIKEEPERETVPTISDKKSPDKSTKDEHVSTKTLASPPVPKQPDPAISSSKAPVHVKDDINKQTEPAEASVTPKKDATQTSKDLIPTAKDRPVTPKKESQGLEQDAALALLQMWNKKPEAALPAEPSSPSSPETPPRRQQTQEQINMANEHNYFAPMVTPEKDKRKKGAKRKEAVVEEATDSASEGEPELTPCLPPEIAADHNYCQPYLPVELQPKQQPLVPVQLQPGHPQVYTDIPLDIGFDTVEVEVSESKPRTAREPKGRGRKKQLQDVTNLGGSRELAALLPPPMKPVPKFESRSFKDEVQITYDFLINGIDQEDVNFLKRRYEELLQDDSPQTYWLNDTHWVDHSHTRIPDPVPPKRRKKHAQDDVPTPHKTGCARTEGYYKIPHQQKSTYLVNMRGVQEQKGMEEDALVKDVDTVAKKKVQQSREARSESRRWQSVLSSLGEDYGDLFKFNQLKFRKKHLKFARSGIHDWGLFALEPIQEGEMVIEYVGQVVRQTIADLREKKYENMGIGSSYLFRIDHDTIIDATKCGNLARFINHSCNPNCYAKIIPVESHKKIVIYSKRDIDVNEEIVYDYKFPLEDEKIPCWCGAPNCRGTLN